MSVEERTGNLFEQTDLAAIAQGVNLRGVMGSGIAPQFKRIWRPMFDEYVEWCRDGRLQLGGVHPWRAPSGVWIYNLGTQVNTGRDARLPAIVDATQTMLNHAATHGVASIGVPRIGSGIGGLRWQDVKPAITSVAHDHSVRVVLVSLPNAT